MDAGAALAVTAAELVDTTSAVATGAFAVSLFSGFCSVFAATALVLATGGGRPG